ncbi:hypothetical protein [Streptomyces fuscigenes]|uniref:hypothetical protein n=1 Tax=Streptomyces fuscigenes TaxID=1528880 RepID=UPI001F36327D|nr:hypothetical protein [Streptomyces fuscigenes]MCF3960300.1 hypothetical protein [Streptomyces fuscigenes]
MTSTTPRRFTRLDRHTADFRAGEEAQEEARKALYAAIIRHLTERNARPGKIADHTPYDRNWIGELGRQAGVPPLKGPNAVGPAPKYDPATQAAALEELDALTAEYDRAKAAIEKARGPIHEEIIKHYEAGVGPEVLAQHSPYDRNWIGQIARSASVTRQRQKSPAPTE